MKKMTKLCVLFLIVNMSTAKLSAQCDLIQNGALFASSNTPNTSNPDFIIDAFTLNLVPSWYKLLVSPDIHLNLGQGTISPLHCARLAL